jgi:transcriptional regulator with XRE-family HTH domain
MPRNTGDTSRSRALGAELRRLRERQRPDGSLRSFADEIDVSATAISRWENGHKPPSTEDIGVVLGALGVRGDEREHFLEMARDALDPTWVAPGVDKQLTALIDFEASATTIVEVSPLLIPGLLQTADYARVIMDDGSMSAGQIQSAVTTRMGRQRILTQENPASMVALIGETVLRRPIGGPSVMAAQLRHIAKMAELDNVTVQAIPVGPSFNPSLAGPFTLHEFPVAPPIVHFEHHRSSMFLPDKRDIEDMQKAAQTIQETAMSPKDTSGLITNAIEEMEHGS